MAKSTRENLLLTYGHRCEGCECSRVPIFGNMMRFGNKKRELTASDRKSAFLLLYNKLENGELKRGSITQVAKLFDCHRSTMTRFWRAQVSKLEEILNNEPGEDGEPVDPSKFILDLQFYESGKTSRGRKVKWDPKIVKAECRKLPLKERKTWRSLSAALHIPLATLHNMYTSGRVFRRHSSSLKPVLTEENKIARLIHALEEVNMGTLDEEKLTAQFKDMYDRVDIDEKWFYLTRDNESYILTIASPDDKDKEDEEEPNWKTKNKLHITKVMFLAAQAQPRWDPCRNAYWDGKIGMWPVGEWTPAERTSRNRPRGAPIWKNTSIDKSVYRQLLIEKVLPAIKEKWPRGSWSRNNVIIRVQQDGALSHIAPADEEFVRALERMEMTYKLLLYTQPPNSPECNINDLGFFRALQSHYERSSPRDEKELIDCVLKAYDEYDLKKINLIYLSLMGVYNQIIDANGGNKFKLPHLGKQRLE